MRRTENLLLIAGLALVTAALGQYGYMFFRQGQLRFEWKRQAIGKPQPQQSRLRLIRLKIPAIHLDDIVVPGDGYRALLEGPEWLPQSARAGTQGNMVIAGHRDTFFRRLYAVRPGTLILVQANGRKFTYRVAWKKIISPRDTAVLQRGHRARVTLITCYPTYWIGPAPHRLVVRAHLIITQQ